MPPLPLKETLRIVQCGPTREGAIGDDDGVESGSPDVGTGVPLQEPGQLHLQRDVVLQQLQRLHCMHPHHWALYRQISALSHSKHPITPRTWRPRSNTRSTAGSFLTVTSAALTKASKNSCKSVQSCRTRSVLINFSCVAVLAWALSRATITSSCTSTRGRGQRQPLERAPVNRGGPSAAKKNVREEYEALAATLGISEVRTLEAAIRRVKELLD